jgi:hypothetical protein
MNEERLIRKLAERARMETPPQVEVASRVMAILRARCDENVAPEGPLVWVAAFSAAVAVPMALLAFSVWKTWMDPLVGIFINGPWGIL